MARPYELEADLLSPHDMVLSAQGRAQLHRRMKLKTKIMTHKRKSEWDAHYRRAQIRKRTFYTLGPSRIMGVFAHDAWAGRQYYRDRFPGYEGRENVLCYSCNNDSTCALRRFTQCPESGLWVCSVCLGFQQRLVEALMGRLRVKTDDDDPRVPYFTMTSSQRVSVNRERDRGTFRCLRRRIPRAAATLPRRLSE